MNAALTSSRHDLRRHTTSAWPLRHRALCIAVLLGLAHVTTAWAAAPASAAVDAGSEDMEFDSSFFKSSGGSDGVDISRFDRGAVVLPGVYSLDVNVNKGAWQGKNTLPFQAPKGQANANAQPCFTRDMLVQWGIDLTKVTQYRLRHPALATHALPTSTPVCAPLSALVPDASASFDASSLSMQVSVPQLYLNKRHGNWADPSQWQTGLNAGFADYSFNANTNRGHGYNATDAFLSISSGINVNGWRLRQVGGLDWNNSGNQGSHFHYHSSAAYLQHDLTKLRSQLTIGDYVTSGRVFDAVPFRGVNIASDDSMLPNDQLGFAPVVRGVANTNAKVTIRQHGQIIYQTSVAPGPFAITDLPTIGGSGNLQVTVTEADGRQETRMVPYSYISNLLRPGVSRYSVTTGLLNLPSLRHRPPMLEATYQRGISNMVTAYGGITGSAGYGAGLVGAAFNTPMGALGLDLTVAHTNLPGQRTHNGQSLHLTFTKSWAEGTNLTFGAYRYSTGGYYSLAQAETARYPNMLGAANDQFDTLPQRSQLQFSVMQSLGKYGSFSLDGTDVRYWHDLPSQITYGASYSNNFFHNDLNVQLSLQRTRQMGGNTNGTSYNPYMSLPPNYMPLSGHRTDTQLMLTVSIPLGHSSSAPSFSTAITHDMQSGTSYNTGIAGSLGQNGVFTYNANLQHDSSGDNGYNLGAQYMGSQGTIQASIGHSANAEQASLNVNGSAVFFRHGVVLGPSLNGNSFAIVHAPGAAGAHVTTTTQVRLDRHGYAVVPNLQPYHRNEVDLDPEGLPLNVDLLQTSRIATPRAGSAVLLEFATHAGGRAVVIDTKLLDGDKITPIPFGADVFDEQGHTVGVVGQDSRILARNLPDAGTLTVQWGDKDDQRCMIDYHLPPQKGAERYTHITANCIAGAILTHHDSKPVPSVTKMTAPHTQTELEGTTAASSADKAEKEMITHGSTM